MFRFLEWLALLVGTILLCIGVYAVCDYLFSK